MNKRGLSTVITTLILIAVSLVAVFGVGVFIKNFSQEKSEFITAEGLTLDVQISNVEILSDTEMKVQVKRNPGGSDISGVVFVVYDINNSEVHKRNVSLDELEKRNFDIILEVLNTSYVHKITVAPIFETSSGKEIVGTNEAERIINPRSGGGGSSSSGSSTPDSETCPDGTCGTGETCSNCPADCGVCSTEECDLTNATVSPSQVSDGNLVSILFAGENCDGRSFELDLYAILSEGDQSLLDSPIQMIFSENSFCQACINEERGYWCSEENVCKDLLISPTSCLSGQPITSSANCPTESDSGDIHNYTFVWQAYYQPGPAEYYFRANVLDSSESIQSSPNFTIVEFVCNDGICESGFENPATCPEDCLEITTVCGDGACMPGEAPSCTQDCGTINIDGTCMLNGDFWWRLMDLEPYILDRWFGTNTRANIIGYEGNRIETRYELFSQLSGGCDLELINVNYCRVDPVYGPVCDPFGAKIFEYQNLNWPYTTTHPWKLERSPSDEPYFIAIYNPVIRNYQAITRVNDGSINLERVNSTSYLSDENLYTFPDIGSGVGPLLQNGFDPPLLTVELPYTCHECNNRGYQWCITSGEYSCMESSWDCIEPGGHRLTTCSSINRNPGFEEGFDYWTISSNVELASNIVRSGSYSARVENFNIDTRIEMGQIPLEPDTIYNFSVWTYVPSGELNSYTWQIYPTVYSDVCTTGTGAGDGNSHCFEATRISNSVPWTLSGQVKDEWRIKHWTFRTDSNAETLHLILWGNGGPIYFDDAVLEIVG